VSTVAPVVAGLAAAARSGDILVAGRGAERSGIPHPHTVFVVAAGLAPSAAGARSRAVSRGAPRTPSTDVGAERANALRVQPPLRPVVINRFHAVWAVGSDTGRGLMGAGAIAVHMKR